MHKASQSYVRTLKMRSFAPKSISLALALLGTAQAHTTFTTLFVDGVNQGDGVCIRMHNDFEEATYPIPHVTSKDVACGTLTDSIRCAL